MSMVKIVAPGKTQILLLYFCLLWSNNAGFNSFIKLKLTDNSQDGKEGQRKWELRNPEISSEW